MKLHCQILTWKENLTISCFCCRSLSDWALSTTPGGPLDDKTDGPSVGLVMRVVLAHFTGVAVKKIGMARFSFGLEVHLMVVFCCRCILQHSRAIKPHSFAGLLCALYVHLADLYANSNAINHPCFPQPLVCATHVSCITYLFYNIVITIRDIYYTAYTYNIYHMFGL